MKSKLSKSLPPEILEALAETQNQMAESAKTREAAHSNVSVVAAAKQALDGIAAQLVEAEMKQAVCCDEKSLPQLEAEIERLITSQTEKQLAYDRAVRLGKALKIRASELDNDNRLAREKLDAIVSGEAQIQADKIYAEMQDALRPLVAVLKKAFALNAAGVNARALTQAICDINIPDPKHYGQSLVWSGRAALHGEHETLSDSWREDEEAMALFDQYKAIGEAKGQLGKYVPRLQTLKATSAGYTIEGLNGGIKTPSQPTPQTSAQSQPQELNLGPALTAQHE